MHLGVVKENLPRKTTMSGKPPNMLKKDTSIGAPGRDLRDSLPELGENEELSSMPSAHFAHIPPQGKTEKKATRSGAEMSVR